MKIELTERQIAIVGAALRQCIGWTDPREMQRFVNIAAEAVNDGWSEDEMSAVLETISGQYFDQRGPLRH